MVVNNGAAPSAGSHCLSLSSPTLNPIPRNTDINTTTNNANDITNALYTLHYNPVINNWINEIHRRKEYLADSCGYSASTRRKPKRDNNDAVKHAKPNSRFNNAYTNIW
jgi:hypothetical protein